MGGVEQAGGCRAARDGRGFGGGGSGHDTRVHPVHAIRRHRCALSFCRAFARNSTALRSPRSVPWHAKAHIRSPNARSRTPNVRMIGKHDCPISRNMTEKLHATRPSPCVRRGTACGNCAGARFCATTVRRTRLPRNGVAARHRRRRPARKVSLGPALGGNTILRQSCGRTPNRRRNGRLYSVRYSGRCPSMRFRFPLQVAALASAAGALALSPAQAQYNAGATQYAPPPPQYVVPAEGTTPPAMARRSMLRAMAMPPLMAARRPAPPTARQPRPMRPRLPAMRPRRAMPRRRPPAGHDVPRPGPRHRAQSRLRSGGPRRSQRRHLYDDRECRQRPGPAGRQRLYRTPATARARLSPARQLWLGAPAVCGRAPPARAPAPLPQPRPGDISAGDDFPVDSGGRMRPTPRRPYRR